MKKIQIISTITLTAILASSCATGENYQSKMDRYSPRTAEKNIVPDINAKYFSFKEAKTRAPAQESKLNGSQSEGEISFTNKKLYFLTMLDQYETLKSLVPNTNAPSISLCPNFHTGLLNHNEKFGKKSTAGQFQYNYSMSEIGKDEYVDQHPELYLPLTKESKTPRIVDIARNKKELSKEELSSMVTEAVNIHLSKTYYELNELCEYGTSDNYYIYENMITHTKTNSFKPSNANLNVLLKTTVFSNLALINSISRQVPKTSGRSIASVKPTSENTYSQELFGKMNAVWAKDYFTTLKN